MTIEVLPLNKWVQAYTVMKELRPHLSEEAFLQLSTEAHKADQYSLVGIFEQNQIVAVMGYRILTDFVHGRHLYIDDLVTKESHRSQGLGAQLLKWAEAKAKELGIKNLRLCTGIENESGKKFYERENWNFRAIVYKKKV